MNASNRLDGWKAIGSHFGRDRTTVMRWARERALPVRRLPGGKTGTVYALKDELDQWARGQDDLGVHEPEPEPSLSVRISQMSRRHVWKLAGAGLGLAAAGTTAFVLRPSKTSATAAVRLPSNPEVTALYLQGRDQWAQRKPDSLRAAIASFTTVTQREPGFAPAWAALADAYLLSQEFGDMPRADAFEKARASADAALKLDPDLADAHRARGFILYWWDRKPAEAGKAFRRALDLAPRSAQTHFWYGNILSDNGQHASALRELNTARLLEPGSVAIQTDLAWAQWAAGDDAIARQSLTTLAQSHPDFAVIHDCLSLIHLADGDYVTYVQEYAVFARLLGDAIMIRQAQDLRAALPKGVEAVQGELIQQSQDEMRRGVRQTHVWSVLLASLAQDRGQVLDLLTKAEERRERWGNSAFVGRILRLWSGDEEITRRVGRLRAPPVE